MSEEYPEFIKIIYTDKQEPCKNGCKQDVVSLFSKRVENKHKIPFSKFSNDRVLDDALKEGYTYTSFVDWDCADEEDTYHEFTVYPIRIEPDDSDTEKMILAEQKTYERTVKETYESEQEATSLLQKQINDIHRMYNERRNDLAKIREITKSDMIKLFSE